MAGQRTDPGSKREAPRWRFGFLFARDRTDTPADMPELPEVETVVRDVRPLATGRRIAAVAHASPLMAVSVREPFETELPGRTLEALRRHGKWMFFDLSGAPAGDVLVVHLGMTGRLSVVDADEPVTRHTHLRLALDGGGELRFADPRRFGELLLYDADRMHRRFGPHALGPDALTVRLPALRTRLAGSRRRIKAALLDQKTVAGIGNIYADEALFAARVHPAEPAGTVVGERLRKLAAEIRKVLRRSLAHHGTSVRDYVTGRGVPGEFQNHLKVYGRGGQPCRRCEAELVLDRTILNGRATVYCPVCQEPGVGG